MRILIALLLSFWTASAATYYVSTNGNDLSGDGAAWATAWRTIAKAESSIANGDTVTVGAGDYQEYVNISGITNMTFLGVSNAQSCAFRFSAPSNTVSGFRLIAAQNEGIAATWESFLRVEPAAHGTVITNCDVGDCPG